MTSTSLLPWALVALSGLCMVNESVTRQYHRKLAALNVCMRLYGRTLFWGAGRSGRGKGTRIACSPSRKPCPRPHVQPPSHNQAGGRGLTNDSSAATCVPTSSALSLAETGCRQVGHAGRGCCMNVSRHSRHKQLCPHPKRTCLGFSRQMMHSRAYKSTGGATGTVTGRGGAEGVVAAPPPFSAAPCPCSASA